MMQLAWDLLSEELEKWSDIGETASLWWRDDDACADTKALKTLNQLSIDYSVPLHLAIIPASADDSLLPLFEENPNLWGLQHGYSHRSYSSPQERKCELGNHRSLDLILDELESGQQKLRSLLGENRFNPTLVPPWNRIADELLPLLSSRGFVGLSTLKPRPQQTQFGLTQVNVHIDIIDWKQRSFGGEERALQQLTNHLQQRRLGRADRGEATGLMTHHLDHDPQCWDFCQKLFEFLEQQPVSWKDQSELFPRN